MEQTLDVLICEDLGSDRPLVQASDQANVIELPASSTQLPGLRRSDFRIERAQIAGRVSALILTAPGSRMRRNGLRAPLVAPLEIGDQLALDSRKLLHFSRRQQPEAIQPPAALVGRRCEVCQVVFTPTTLVVLCPSCGDARHLEGPEVPEGERLECAEIGACPNCQAERPRAGGFAYWPEG